MLVPEGLVLSGLRVLSKGGHVGVTLSELAAGLWPSTRGARKNGAAARVVRELEARGLAASTDGGTKHARIALTRAGAHFLETYSVEDQRAEEDMIRHFEEPELPSVLPPPAYEPPMVDGADLAGEAYFRGRGTALDDARRVVLLRLCDGRLAPNARDALRGVLRELEAVPA